MTSGIWITDSWGIHFYSHIPCGMWQFVNDYRQRHDSFLLTHPVWDVTVIPTPVTVPSRISTHTSRVGCDVADTVSNDGDFNFYSHIPCGMWLSPISFICLSGTFLLTHPVWDVTVLQQFQQPQNLTISTHTSRVGCDKQSITGLWLYLDFYSHIPCGMWRSRHYK